MVVCCVSAPTIVQLQACRPLLQVDEKVGVLLLNLGGPETLDDVQPFLYNLFADPDIIRLPSYAKFLQPVVAQVQLRH
jgi:protoporphyrin/coproporphyrin ferrochelatase